MCNDIIHEVRMFVPWFRVELRFTFYICITARHDNQNEGHIDHNTANKNLSSLRAKELVIIYVEGGWGKKKGGQGYFRLAKRVEGNLVKCKYRKGHYLGFPGSSQCFI